MSIAVSAEHAELGSAVRRFLQTRCPPAVARAGVDDEGPEPRPDFWSDFAALGWLTLHLPEQDGGGGFGLSELAVVLDELGRAAAPGPFLPTALAAGLVARGGAPPLRTALLPEVAAGRTSAAVALPGLALATRMLPDGSLVAEGRLRPVMGAALASWVVVGLDTEAGRRWCVLDAAELTITELPSLDLTRRVAEVRADSVVVPAGALLQLDDSSVRSLAAVMVAAESAGGAGWCVETAAEWARSRQQFGRPIGQFQGVKHRCAEMLVTTEAIRAAAWESASAWDGAASGSGGDPGAHGSLPADVGLSADIAGALGADGYCRVAKDCIQVLGGIGFTWEHDAHRYLRRATSLRSLMSGPTPWRLRAARAAAGGTRRQLTLERTSPEGDDGGTARQAIAAVADAIAAAPKEERRARLVEAGYLMPHWPAPWGVGAGAAEQLMIDEELARVRVRRPGLNIGAWAAPTIIVHGSPAQQERWVRPTLLGQVNWCQLFSEPGAGSDLASLTTRAERAEGGWVVNGQKVWTSMAAEADWGMLLARTDSGADRHGGITWFALDMRSPGIEVRPLREMTGLTLFNEVFLDDVFVPDDCVVGTLHDGWRLARTTLANERVAMGSGASFGGGLEAVLALAGEDLDDLTADALGALVAESHVVAVLGQRAASRALGGAEPGPEASVRKLLSAEHDQRTQEFGLALLGPDGAASDGAGAQWSYGFLANRCLTIAGGTSEIQRNVIAERLLGLPRDPDPPPR